MKRYITTILYLMFILVGSIAFLSIAGIRVGLLAPLSGFLIIKITVIASIFLCILSVIGLSCHRRRHKASITRFYVICILISLGYSAFWITFHYQKKQLPLLSDIVTNVDKPLMFIRVVNLRHTDENTVDYLDEFSVLQKKHYPNIQPLQLKEDARTVFDRAVALVQDNGWDVVSLYPKEGVIEATVTTPVFWFVDDVIIRVQNHEDGCIVDMRSSSRIGRGDYGTNANRVRTFLQELSERASVSEAPSLSHLDSVVY